MSAADFLGRRTEEMYSGSPTHNALLPSLKGLFPPFLAAIGACSLLINVAAITVARNEDFIGGSSRPCLRETPDGLPASSENKQMFISNASKFHDTRIKVIKIISVKLGMTKAKVVGSKITRKHVYQR
jgi:hypothetical protein